jgi:hypothetical protein
VEGEDDLTLNKPDLVSGVECEEGYSELNFDNKNFISSGDHTNKDSTSKEVKPKTFFGKVGSFFDKTAKQIKEMKIGEKAEILAKKGVQTAKEGGKFVSQKAKEGGTFVSKKAKEVMVSIFS